MRKNVGKKKLLLTVLSALTLSLAATIGAFADESDTSKLVSGTKINGVGVGGLTPDEAKARIEGFYAGEYTLNIKEKGGKEESIKGSDIGYQVTVSGSIQNILDSQNATGRVAGPSGENTHTMEVSAQYNEEALNNKISNLSCCIVSCRQICHKCCDFFLIQSYLSIAASCDPAGHGLAGKDF